MIWKIDLWWTRPRQVVNVGAAPIIPEHVATFVASKKQKKKKLKKGEK